MFLKREVKTKLKLVISLKLDHVALQGLTEVAVAIFCLGLNLNQLVILSIEKKPNGDSNMLVYFMDYLETDTRLTLLS